MRDAAAPDAPTALARRADPDRFLTALFAPPEKRATLMLLYAFNHELARAREVAREPALALIRLQWWREVVEGARRRHEIAEPLSEAIAAGRLAAADLLAMVNGREIEAEPGIATLERWRDYLRGTAGALALAAGRLLGADQPMLERLTELGTGYGVAGQLRGIATLAAHGRCLLPRDVLAAHGLSEEQVIARPGDARLSPALAVLARHGQTLLRRPAPMPRAILAAALPAVLARRDLARVGQAARRRGLGDKVAVLAAAVSGRA
jgi:phytoene synthase